MRSVALLYIFVNLFYVWFIKRQLDSIFVSASNLLRYVVLAEVELCETIQFHIDV